MLAADTVVAVGRRILPKVEDEETLRACMRLLSGRRHRVLTGVALAIPGGGVRERLVETMIAMKRLSEDEIDYYAGHGEWRGKAGGYALQGYGEVYVRHIAGSYSNVVGLPLAETRRAAESRRATRLPDWLIERGIGETRCALVEDGEIVEARDPARRRRPGRDGARRRALEAVGQTAIADCRRAEYLLPNGAPA